MIDLYKAYAEFQGLSLEKAKNLCRKARESFADEWRKANPKTEDEMIRFYKNTKYGLPESIFFHMETRPYWDLILVKIVKDECPQATTLLDYGCGTGINGILFAKAGFKVTLADLGHTFEFAKFLAGKYGVDAEFIDVDRENLGKRTWDVILALTVFEHVARPLDVLEELERHLSSTGKMFIVVDFGKKDILPMHSNEPTRSFYDKIFQLICNDRIGGYWDYSKPWVWGLF